MILTTMNVYLGHLSNCIQGPLAPIAVRSILDDARTAGRRAPRYLSERALAVYLPAGAVSELIALYQQHTTSPAEFSAALWPVMGYEPGSSPGEEVRGST